MSSGDGDEVSLPVVPDQKMQRSEETKPGRQSEFLRQTVSCLASKMQTVVPKQKHWRSDEHASQSIPCPFAAPSAY